MEPNQYAIIPVLAKYYIEHLPRGDAKRLDVPDLSDSLPKLSDNQSEGLTTLVQKILAQKMKASNRKVKFQDVDFEHVDHGCHGSSPKHLNDVLYERYPGHAALIRQVVRGLGKVKDDATIADEYATATVDKLALDDNVYCRQCKHPATATCTVITKWLHCLLTVEKPTFTEHEVIRSIASYYLQHLQSKKAKHLQAEDLWKVLPEVSKVSKEPFGKEKERGQRIGADIIKNFLAVHVNFPLISVHRTSGDELHHIFNSRGGAYPKLIWRVVRDLGEKDVSVFVWIAEKLAINSIVVCQDHACMANRKTHPLCPLILNWIRSYATQEFKFGTVLPRKTKIVDFVSTWAANHVIHGKMPSNLHAIPDNELDIIYPGHPVASRFLLDDFLRHLKDTVAVVTVEVADIFVLDQKVRDQQGIFHGVIHSTMWKTQQQRKAQAQALTHVTLADRKEVARLLDLGSVIKIPEKEKDLLNRWLSALSLIAPGSFLLPESSSEWDVCAAAKYLAQLLSEEQSLEATLSAFQMLVKQSKGRTSAIVALHEHWFLSDRSNRKIPILEIAKDPYNGLAKHDHLPLRIFIETMGLKALSDLNFFKHFFCVTNAEDEDYKRRFKRLARFFHPNRDADLLTAEIQALISKVLKAAKSSKAISPSSHIKQGNPTSKPPKHT